MFLQKKNNLKINSEEKGFFFIYININIMLYLIMILTIIFSGFLVLLLSSEIIEL